MELAIEFRLMIEVKSNKIYVDGELFDWAVPEEALEELEMCYDPVWKMRCYQSIRNHFIHSFSEFVAREVTLKEINEAVNA